MNIFKKTNIFEIDETIKSYKPSILKLIVTVVFIAILFALRMCVSYIVPPFANYVIGFIFGVSFFIAIIRICIISCEIILLHDRREKSLKSDIKSALKQSRIYPVEYVLSLLKDNDVIDITLFYENEIIRIGASSNYERSRSFFDKRFYTNDKENVSIDTITDLLNNCSSNGDVCILLVDGTKPKDTRNTAKQKNVAAARKKRTQTKRKASGIIKNFVICQFLLLIIFGPGLYDTIPIDESECVSEQIVVEDKSLNPIRGTHSSRHIFVCSNDTRYMLANPLSAEYSQKELYEKITIGATMEITYAKRCGLFGTSNFVVDAKSENDTYIDFTSYYEDYVKVHLFLCIIFITLEIILLSVFIYKIIYKYKLFCLHQKKDRRQNS